MEADPAVYPPIADHGMIGDCHTAALIRSDGTIDWCCLPRFDSASVFGCLLDAAKGGGWSLEATGDRRTVRRRYLDDSLVLETAVETSDGAARIIDFFPMRVGGRRRPRRMLMRIVEGIRGSVRFRTRLAPRFDYGNTLPWIREHTRGVHSAVGSSNGLVIWADIELQHEDDHALAGGFTVDAGERRHLAARFQRPEEIVEPRGPSGAELDGFLEETLDWWRAWSSKGGLEGPDGPGAMRSAIVLKALTHAPTGAMVAAPTTSLPEAPGGERNWDYRYSWIRDSSFAVRVLDELGLGAEAEGFRRFVERSAAGSVHQLQVLYGVGGERWLPELTIDHLSGYRGARPVRVGNRAARQLQLDIFGELVDVAWEWHLRGHSPTADYWRFLRGIVDEVAKGWSKPDRGIWEVRGRPQHFVHSKMMCWVALDRAVRLAQETDLDDGALVERWTAVRDEIRARIETDGYDERRGVFRRAFGSDELDAALLLLPEYRFVAYDDPRMIRTVDALREELERDGLTHRYRAEDGLPGDEGVFLACTFWLAECLARQGRLDEARTAFDRACSTANDVGLFGEEFDPARGETLGNFPQGLTHLAHIGAA
ncbi:MAG TPA: glycoside hydrolase family 15 protein, partial [Actinomycetota bacterium]|nr:glycoside hydrolase family 15 protein [Actinomycetota bacterium]